jgi:hypothetical protein
VVSNFGGLADLGRSAASAHCRQGKQEQQGEENVLDSLHTQIMFIPKRG